VTMEKRAPTDPSLYQAFSAIAEARAESIALVHAGEDLSFGQLKQRIDLAAMQLVALGVRSGDAVAMIGQNCPEFLYCYLAAARLGAIFVPVNSNLSVAEIAYIVDHSEAKWLFHDESVAAVAGSPRLAGKCRPLTDLSSASPGGSLPLSAQADPAQDLLIAYTSGSTGTPKAVVMDHRAQIRAAQSMAELWQLTPQDVSVVAAPMGFLLGLSTSATVALLCGMKIVLNRRFHPAEVLEALTSQRATMFHGVPTMYSMMLEYSEQQGLPFDLSHTRSLLCSGAPMPPEMARRFGVRFGRAPQNYFGMTECYPLVATYANDSSKPPAGAAGRIVPGAALRFLDADGMECENGNPGEMFARAPSMLKRYHKAPELTAACLVDGWFRTGDLGYRDAEGFVYITGRVKDLIIRGGANIAPAEVENVLTRHGAVRSAAVIGVPDDLFGEVPAAYVVRHRTAQLDEEELLAFAKEELASFKVPAYIFFCDDLPVGSTGKVDKAALKLAWASRKP